MTSGSESALDRLLPTRRPRRRAVMRQDWRDLLFLHWPVAPETVQRLLPPGLTVDTFDGQAYVGLVPFRVQGVRPPWAPPLPGFPTFLECNVRTYVHRAGAGPGVWFFSLDAADPAAVAAARALWHLPYQWARMSADRDADGATRYRTERIGPGPAAMSTFRYLPTGSPSPAAPGTLEFFLIERYLLYAWSRGRLWRGQVHHAPYPLQSARLDTLTDTSVAAAGIDLGERLARPPLAHWASGVNVEVFPLTPLA